MNGLACLGLAGEKGNKTRTVLHAKGWQGTKGMVVQAAAMLLTTFPFPFPVPNNLNLFFPGTVLALCGCGCAAAAVDAVTVAAVVVADLGS